MSRHISIFLITLFLNTWAGDERALRAAQRPPDAPSFAQAAATPRAPQGTTARAPQGATPRVPQGTTARAPQDSTARAPQGATPEARGAWLARQVDERDTGRDARMDMRMKLHDRQQRVRERALSLISIRGGAGRPVPADRSLIRFTHPADIKGTGFLVWEQPDADDERFLYLPSLGRVRRIAGSEAQESFVGSDFTYEDIGGREFENYTYRLIETPSIETTWTAPDGSTHAVYTLESRSRDASARFPRVVSLVLKDHLVVVRAEIRNRRDEPQKLYEALRVEKVLKKGSADGYWTVLEMRMTDSLQRTKTELVLERVEYDVGLKADDFSRRELERGGTGPIPEPSAGAR